MQVETMTCHKCSHTWDSRVLREYMGEHFGTPAYESRIHDEDVVCPRCDHEDTLSAAVCLKCLEEVQNKGEEKSETELRIEDLNERVDRLGERINAIEHFRLLREAQRKPLSDEEKNVLFLMSDQLHQQQCEYLREIRSYGPTEKKEWGMM